MFELKKPDLRTPSPAAAYVRGEFEALGLEVGARRYRALKRVAFVNQEAPLFFWGEMGSKVYARASRRALLEVIGAFRARYPAVMVTDTAYYRTRHYHCATDTPDRLRYPEMARVVEGLAASRSFWRRSTTTTASKLTSYDVKGEEDMTYKRILVPVDGSRASQRGLREAIRLAKGQKASLQLVHVVDEHTVLVSAAEVGPDLVRLMLVLRKQGAKLLRNAAALVRRNGLKCTSVLLEAQNGPAADLIVRQARKSGADLVVIGTHGRRGLRRLIMGSDAEQIVRSAPVPVMLVRAPGA